MNEQRIRVSERALVQRINRRLEKDSEQLKTSRGERAEVDVGKYYIINTDRNTLVRYHVDIEALGRKVGALQPWEKLEK